MRHNIGKVGLWVATVLFAAGVALTACGTATESGEADVCANIACGEGVCVDLDGHAACDCNSGYVADGLSCKQDPCTPDPCAYGFCRVVNGQALCQCDEGYTGANCDQCSTGYMPRGNVCAPGDPCESDPCVYGLCSLVEGESVCTCDAGYIGELCDVCAEGYHAQNLRCVSDNPCSPNPCIHGSCNVEGSLTVCACDAGYAGEICDGCAEGYRQEGILCVVDVPVDDPCDPNPCPDNDDEHRGQCVAVGGDAVCSCDPGYVLKDDVCISADDPTLDPCEPNPCEEANRTVCVANGDDFSCLCDPGMIEDPESGDCAEDTTDIPTRNCEATLSYRSSSNGPIYVRGEHNSWGLTDAMIKTDGVWTITYSDLQPGDYAYKLFDASANSWMLDSGNPYTMYSGGQQNSRLRMPDCSLPALTLDGAPQVSAGSIQFTVSAAYGREKSPLDPDTAIVKMNGYDVPDGMVSYDANTGVFTVDASGLENGKYSFLFSISDAQGRKAKPVFVPVWIEDSAFDWRDATLYFTMTDRFVDGDPSNNRAINGLTVQTNWQGGDFAGIKAKINAGYFTDLGVNVLWISSPIMNTQTAWPGSDGRSYSGYHSYWPISTGWTGENPLSGVQAVDPHFGDLDELKELVQAAHDKGIRVIADFVANHVHTDSPYWQQHRNSNPPWFHYINGNPYVCGWDKPIECWFAEYLPDFEYKNIDVMKTVMDHAIWLIQESNIDGFRLDAVKHMVLDFSTTIRARIDDEIDTVPGIRFYMVGETFTGEDEQSTIAYYVGKNMLDGQFDFPMFWKALKTLVRYESNLYELKNFTEGNIGYYGPDSIMSTFLGNHDVPRAISHAAGDIGDLWGNGSKEQAWNNPPSAPGQDWPYKRLQLAWTYLFTQQGIPMIYYGDEIGLPGAGDPDNRRMMIFGNSLNSYQGQTLQHVQKLGKARLAHAALRRGQLQTRTIENDLWAYTLKSGTDGAVVVLNRGGARSLSVSVSGVLDNGTVLKDVVSGSTVTVSGGAVSLSVGGGMSAVYVRQ